MTQSLAFGTLDSALFVLVIVAAFVAGSFQGWFEGIPQHEDKRGLAITRGRGPIFDFFYLMVLTGSAPFVFGKQFSTGQTEQCQTEIGRHISKQIPSRSCRRQTFFILLFLDGQICCHFSLDWSYIHSFHIVTKSALSASYLRSMWRLFCLKLCTGIAFPFVK